MQIDVSVKKPIGRSWNAAIPLEPHQIARYLGVAAFGGHQIERQRRELVDDRDGARVLQLIDRNQVTPAHLARVDPKVREELHVRENRHLRTRRLAARRAGHSAHHPCVGAARAHESALRRQKSLARFREYRDLRKAAAARAMPIVGGLAAPERRRQIGECLEHRLSARSSEERVRTRCLVAVEPCLDKPLEVGLVKTNQRGLAKGLSARSDRRLHDPGQRRANNIGREVVAAGAIGPRSLESALLRIDNREVEPERLLCEVEARPELACALAALLVRRRRFGKERHQSFSIFTRNALNSGVLALASPTNGVSAFASQYFDRSGFCSAETPTNPQWIGIPIW